MVTQICLKINFPQKQVCLLFILEQLLTQPQNAQCFCILPYRNVLYLSVFKGCVCMFERPCMWHKEYMYTDYYSQICKQLMDQQNYSANLSSTFFSRIKLNQDYTRGKRYMSNKNQYHEIFILRHWHQQQGQQIPLQSPDLGLQTCDTNCLSPCNFMSTLKQKLKSGCDYNI